jgi:hypothetical protein
MTERIVEEFGNTYIARYFFDTDLGNGIDISCEGEHIGSILGEEIPDEDADEEEIEAFNLMVIAWIVDNH